MANLRKDPRQVFHYNARIATGPNAPQIKCSIADISKGGAHLLLESDEPLPAEFLLLFTPKGWPRRKCLVVRRNGHDVGVKFVD
jgi:PilZ domain-containing protein